MNRHTSIALMTVMASMSYPNMSAVEVTRSQLRAERYNFMAPIITDNGNTMSPMQLQKLARKNARRRRRR